MSNLPVIQNINLTGDQARILAKIYEGVNSTCSNILNSNDDLYFTDLQTTGVVKIPIASNVTSITGTINYRIGSLVKTYTFSV